jgi:hypothetical protein
MLSGHSRFGKSLHFYVDFQISDDRSPHGYVNQRLQVQLELLMMSGVPFETCRAFTKLWNNKFYYKAASCWHFYWVIYDARIHEYQKTGTLHEDQYIFLISLSLNSS